MNDLFKFGIMGAGNIAAKFVDAVNEHGGCVVSAVASRSTEKAADFAHQHNIENTYDSYEEMLKNEKLDAVYIAATTNAHCELTALCLQYNVPVLCEKAMCRTAAEAKQIFDLAKERNVFVMEAMWSRFFPKLKTAKKWIADGLIGDITLITCGLGFQAAKNKDNRLYNPELGGGAAYDLLVYCYEITRYFFDTPPIDTICMADFAETGVDKTDVVLVKYPNCSALLTSTFEGKIREELIICGTKGRIIMPNPHMAQDCYLYAKDGTELSFCPNEVNNGFVYEIDEVIRCVRSGLTESDTVPHELTSEAAALFDRLLQ